MVSVSLVGSGMSIGASAYVGRCPVSHRAEPREIATEIPPGTSTPPSVLPFASNGGTGPL
jgi:hypothetical protein